MIGNIGSTSFAAMAQNASQGMRPEPPPKPSAADLFSAIDTDGDGQVTESELTELLGNSDSEAVTALLAALDSDSSGSIDTQEFTSVVEDMLSQLEAQRGMHRPPPSGGDAFASMDADGDGSITASELSDAFSAMSEATGQSGPSAEEFMSQFDTNGDGVLSQDELAQARPQHEPPPGPPPGGEGDQQQFIATLLNQYLINNGLSGEGTSGFTTSA